MPISPSCKQEEAGMHTLTLIISGLIGLSTGLLLCNVGVHATRRQSQHRQVVSEVDGLRSATGARALSRQPGKDPALHPSSRRPHLTGCSQ